MIIKKEREDMEELVSKLDSLQHTGMIANVVELRGGKHLPIRIKAL